MGRPDELFEDLCSRCEAAIGDFIVNRVSEELYLDFKRSSDEGKDKKLSQIDRANLAKAISGFGNTAGGVIVWGVDCRTDAIGADIAGSLCPIHDPQRFKSWLEGAVSGATIPSHGGVRHSVTGLRNDGSGFVSTLVPPADNPPLQVPNDCRYMMRAGSSFMPMPHPLLASMFGRRPTPELRIEVTPLAADLSRFQLLKQFSAHIDISLVNNSLVAAREVFVTWSLREGPSRDCVKVGHRGDDTRFKFTGLGGRPGGCAEMNEGTRLSPGVSVSLWDLQLDLAESIGDGLNVEITAGCEFAPPVTITISQSMNNLKNVFADVRSGWNQGDQKFPLAVSQKCFGLISATPGPGPGLQA
jgi:hypothetical protein